MSEQVPIPEGALFTVTSGAYSDYYVRGVFRAKQQINIEAARNEWLDNHPDQRALYSFDESAFLASLAVFMEPVECWELHLTDYRNADEIAVSKMSE